MARTHSITKGSYLCDCCFDSTGVEAPAAPPPPPEPPAKPGREFFVARARAAKANRLAEHLAANGVTARQAARMSQKRWLEAAQEAGTHPPSSHTASRVVALLAAGSEK